jgi:sulfur-oxidizing protein SoxZ
MTTIRISAPATANRDEVIELKAMIQHDMETGYRRDEYGRPIPRNILKHFECLYNGEVVFKAELFPGVAANPFLSFYTTATESGTLLFRWVDQNGQEWSKRVQLEVT